MRVINWYSTSGDNYQEEHLINIDKFLTKDSTEKQNFIAFDQYEESKCIFAKVSRNRAKIHLDTDKKIKLLQRYAPTMVGAKPKVVRGEKCDSWNSGYAIIGERPDRLTGTNGKYVFKKDLPLATKTMLKNIKHIVEQLQDSLTPITSFVR